MQPCDVAVNAHNCHRNLHFNAIMSASRGNGRSIQVFDVNIYAPAWQPIRGALEKEVSYI